MVTNKSVVLHEIENLVDPDQPNHQMFGSSVEDYSVIVIDGMAVVHQITKTKYIQSCMVS